MSKDEQNRDQIKINSELGGIRNALGNKLTQALDNWAKDDRKKKLRVWGSIHLLLNTAGDHEERETAIPAFVRDIVLAFEVDTPIEILRMALSDALHFRMQIVESIRTGRGSMYRNGKIVEEITSQDIEQALENQLTPEQLHALFDGLE